MIYFQTLNQHDVLFASKISNKNKKDIKKTKHIFFQRTRWNKTQYVDNLETGIHDSMIFFFFFSYNWKPIKLDNIVCLEYQSSSFTESLLNLHWTNNQIVHGVRDLNYTSVASWQQQQISTGPFVISYPRRAGNTSVASWLNW